MDWVTSIHQAIQYIEEHLREELTIREIAQQAALSPFYFQKGFPMLCGMTVGHWLLISLCVVIVAVSMVLLKASSPYLGWDYGDPEIAVAGAAFHGFEWLFVRAAPVVLIAALVGVFLTRKKV